MFSSWLDSVTTTMGGKSGLSAGHGEVDMFSSWKDAVTTTMGDASGRVLEGLSVVAEY